MKEEPGFQEVMASPTISFEEEIYYLKGVGFTTVTAKARNAADTKGVMLNSYGEAIVEVDIIGNRQKTLRITLWQWAPIGIYTVELRKNGTVVASDTAEVRAKPTCSEGDKECIGDDLWRCVQGKMTLYKEKDPICYRAGYEYTYKTMPDKLRLEEGTWEVLIGKEWYTDKVYKNITVEKGKTHELIVELPEKLRGVLNCTTNPKGAHVWLRKK